MKVNERNAIDEEVAFVTRVEVVFLWFGLVLWDDVMGKCVREHEEQEADLKQLHILFISFHKKNVVQNFIVIPWKCSFEFRFGERS